MQQEGGGNAARREEIATLEKNLRAKDEEIHKLLHHTERENAVLDSLVKDDSSLKEENKSLILKLEECSALIIKMKHDSDFKIEAPLHSINNELKVQLDETSVKLSEARNSDRVDVDDRNSVSTRVEKEEEEEEKRRRGEEERWMKMERDLETAKRGKGKAMGLVMKLAGSAAFIKLLESSSDSNTLEQLRQVIQMKSSTASSVATNSPPGALTAEKRSPFTSTSTTSSPSPSVVTSKSNSATKSKKKKEVGNEIQESRSVGGGGARATSPQFKKVK